MGSVPRRPSAAIVETLARVWGLQLEPPRSYTVADLRALLEQHGPLWAGEASPGLHVVVVAGLNGDGSPEGTRARIADPWPVGRGERYSITFAEWTRRLNSAAGISGIKAQILHSRDRGPTRRVFEQREEIHVDVTRWPS